MSRSRLLASGAIAVTSIAMALPKQPPKPAPPPEPIVPPQVTLKLRADAPDAGWSMRIENTGDVPLRVVADARLLTLEIERGDGGAPITCALPQDARPSSDLERAILLPPKRSYTERFDPHLYCFGQKEAAALVSGAKVIARYGFPAQKTGALAPPFIASPPDLAPGARDAALWPTPVKELRSEELALPQGSTVTSAPAPPEGPRLRVTMSQRTDTVAAFDQSVTLTVTNEGIRPETLLLVPSTVALEVETPDGRALRCAVGIAPTAVRDLLTTIGPSKGASITIALDRVCPAQTFAREGLYRVVPALDTRRVISAVPITLATGSWAGEPSIVRIRQGKVPRPAPELDPVPEAARPDAGPTKN